MPITKPKIREPVRTILIVDDDTAILKVLARGFEFYGKKVFTAKNGPDGWNLFITDFRGAISVTAI